MLFALEQLLEGGGGGGIRGAVIQKEIQEQPAKSKHLELVV